MPKPAESIRTEPFAQVTPMLSNSQKALFSAVRLQAQAYNASRRLGRYVRQLAKIFAGVYVGYMHFYNRSGNGRNGIANGNRCMGIAAGV